MIARINAKVEKALREAMGHVAHAEEDEIDASFADLTAAERAELIGLSIMVACYVAVDACGSQWPDDSDVRQIAHDLATTGTTAKHLRLDEGEIYAYLSRTVFGPEPLDDVIPERMKAERLAVIVAQRASVVYRTDKEKGWWDYLDQVESAIEVASALDATVLPAAVMRAYLPKPTAEGS